MGLKLVYHAAGTKASKELMEVWMKVLCTSYS